MIGRRGFIAGLITIAAPAIVRPQILMPIKVIRPWKAMTVHVDPTGRIPYSFRILQDAVNFAFSLPPESLCTIQIESGYHEVVPSARLI